MQILRLNAYVSPLRSFCMFLVSALAFNAIAFAQQTLGSINGTVVDSSGAVVQSAKVKVRSPATNLEVAAQTKNDGSFAVADLPIGNYEVTFTKEGFQTAVYPQIIVQGSRTTTVNSKLQPGSVSASVTVDATPLLNETDTTNGYTMGAQQIEAVPLGTGSFTQLAILAPGVNADFLSGSGSNEGLGNQGIVANGQRDTSNLFTFNGVNANNLFNGNSTSNISDSRFTLNTGEIFGVGGQVQTNSSVFDAIGQALPTPPVETIQEVHVATSMYDATMGSASGAHVETTTKSGTNDLHGQLYEYYQSNAFDAAPTFLAPNPFFSGAPPLHRNVFGATLGGPIKKNKLFFFGSYQGQRISDALSGAFNGVPTLPGLTDSNRTDTNALANLVNAADGCPGCITRRGYRSRRAVDFAGQGAGRTVHYSFGKCSDRKFNSTVQRFRERPIKPIQRDAGERERRLPVRSKRPTRRQVLLPERPDGDPIRRERRSWIPTNHARREPAGFDR